MWNNISDEPCDVTECASLISNNFTLNSGGRNVIQRRANTQRINIQRRQNTEPILLQYDEADLIDDSSSSNFTLFNNLCQNDMEFLQKNDILEIDENTELSIYSDRKNSRITSATMIPIVNDDEILPDECSPKKFIFTSPNNGGRQQQQHNNNNEQQNDAKFRHNSPNTNYSHHHKFSNSLGFKKFADNYVELSPRNKQHHTLPECCNKKISLNNNNSNRRSIGLKSSNVSSTITSMMQRGEQDDNNQNVDNRYKQFKIYNSLSSTESMESMDAEEMEILEMESNEIESIFPSNMSSLISGHILKSEKTNTTPEIKRPQIRRYLSLHEDNYNYQARSALFESNTPELFRINQNKNESRTPCSSITPNERCFKRPEPPTPSQSPSQSKRSRLEDISEKENFLMKTTSSLLSSKFTLHDLTTSSSSSSPTPLVPSNNRILRKSMSMNDASDIMNAVAKSLNEPDLIGDFSKPFCLPLMENGRHHDLKSITCDTMAKLIRGEYKDNVASYTIIDCRYPYEYEGGHICGAQNIYTHVQILEELINNKTETAIMNDSTTDGPKRHILIFHCEFSSERGPRLSRFLRNHDRMRNSCKYPALQFPEIYLLHGGYKEFYEKHSNLCTPSAYVSMLDPSYNAEYRQFRAKSKSWNGGDITSSVNNSLILNRNRKSRSRLVL